MKKINKLISFTLISMGVAFWASPVRAAPEPSQQDLRDHEIIESFGYSSRTLAKITERLFLSNVKAAEDRDLLQALGITHILNLTGFEYGSPEVLRYPSKFPEQFQYKHIVIADETDPETMQNFHEHFFKDGHGFIQSALEFSEESRVLIHCEAGISRSSTMVISYLMRALDLSVRDALNQVIEKKSNIGPNHAFFQELLQFEEQNALEKGLQYDGPSYPLMDYLVDQMISGPAAGFSREVIEAALNRAQLDPARAADLLWSQF